MLLVSVLTGGPGGQNQHYTPGLPPLVQLSRKVVREKRIISVSDIYVLYKENYKNKWSNQQLHVCDSVIYVYVSGNSGQWTVM